MSFTSYFLFEFYTGCVQSTFKAEIGNGPCVSCGPNAIRLPMGIGCNCVANYYRAADQKMNYSSICYGKNCTL